MKYGFKRICPKNKKELNSYITDEQIIEHYYGPFELNTFCYSPRGESMPSLIFDIYNDELKWRDFGNSTKPRDAVEFYMYLQELEGNTINYPKAIQCIFEEMESEIGERSIPILHSEPKETTTSLKFRRKFYPWEIEYWQEHEVDEKTLRYFNVFPCELWVKSSRWPKPMLWHRSVKDDPCYVYLWDKVNDIWKAYRPNAPIVRIRNMDIQRKFFARNIGNHVQGLDKIPGKGDILFITKSYKDVITFYLSGFPSIAPHSEATFISASLVSNLKTRFKHIIINYDNDDTGLRKAALFAKEHQLLTWHTPKGYPKDPSALVKDHGRSTFNYLINNYLSTLS